MHNVSLTRRDALWSAMAGSCGALAGISAFSREADAAPAPGGKPSSLTITKVETFSLVHKLPKAIGPSVALSPFLEALLVNISTDSGLAGWGEPAAVGGPRGIIDD